MRHAKKEEYISISFRRGKCMATLVPSAPLLSIPHAKSKEDFDCSLIYNVKVWFSKCKLKIKIKIKT